jgi:hypothetical protein
VWKTDHYGHIHLHHVIQIAREYGIVRGKHDAMFAETTALWSQECKVSTNLYLWNGAGISQPTCAVLTGGTMREESLSQNATYDKKARNNRCDKSPWLSTGNTT